jgi:hypothetical protein
MWGPDEPCPQTQRTRELAARALCRFNDLPENIQYEGKPMWMSYLDEVDVVLKAIAWKPEDTIE